MRRILSAEQRYVNKNPINFIGIKQILLISGGKGISRACYSLALASFGADSTTPRFMARA
jgi:hypothetical protein